MCYWGFTSYSILLFPWHYWGKWEYLKLDGFTRIWWEVPGSIEILFLFDSGDGDGEDFSLNKLVRGLGTLAAQISTFILYGVALSIKFVLLIGPKAPACYDIWWVSFLGAK